MVPKMFIGFQPFNKKIWWVFLVARRIKMCDILGIFKEHPFCFVMERKMGKITCVFSSFSADVQGRGIDQDQITSVVYTKMVVSDGCAVLDYSGQRIFS